MGLLTLVKVDLRSSNCRKRLHLFRLHNWNPISGLNSWIPFHRVSHENSLFDRSLHDVIFGSFSYFPSLHLLQWLCCFWPKEKISRRLSSYNIWYVVCPVLNTVFSYLRQKAFYATVIAWKAVTKSSTLSPAWGGPPFHWLLSSGICSILKRIQLFLD